MPHRSNARVTGHGVNKARTRSKASPKHPAGTQGHMASPPQSPSQTTATRSATVSFSNGKLTVEANNSDLTQILQDLADISGMTIKGLTRGPRIFGVFGPGNSRDILTDLLAGSGYNYIMVGGATDGTPRELLLISRKSDTPLLMPAIQRPVPATELDESEQPNLGVAPAEPNALGPGAVSPAPSQNDQDDNTRMQQNLQRLQQMQEQQQKDAPK